MANTIQSLHRLVHATPTTLYAATTLGAVGTAYLLFKWNAAVARKLQRCSLDALPPDVLLEIFAYLDCVEVVRVRRVCQALCNVTKARPVWLLFFLLDARDSNTRRIYLDKTLESHSAADLEDAVLKPHKGDFAWTNRDPRIRKIGINDKHELLRLLPGGRWCIGRAKSESVVVFYDLSDTGRDEAPHFPLVSNSLPLLPGTQFQSGPVIDIDVDTTTPYLTFNLAVYFTRSDFEALTDNDADGHPILQIWRVMPSFDTGGRINRLIAQHIRTFHRAEHGRLAFLQIHGQCIAIREGEDYCVFDWVNVPPHIDASLPLSWTDDINFQYIIPMGHMHTLLPGRRVLIYNFNLISICYVPPVIPFSCRTDMPSLPIIWTAEVPSRLVFKPGIYGPFFSPNDDVFGLTGLNKREPSLLLTIPRDFTSTEDPHQPRLESVGSLAEDLDVIFATAWSPRRFARLHWIDKESKHFLLRRGCVPYPASPPMVDIVYDDFTIPLYHLQRDEYESLGRITFDEYSSLISVQVATSAGVFVLLFEPY